MAATIASTGTPAQKALMKGLSANSKMEVLRRTAQVIGENFGIDVVFRGDAAYAQKDEKTGRGLITVPSLPDDAPDDLLEAIIGYIDHEAGHIRYTDYAEKRPFEDKDKRVFPLTNAIEDLRQEHLMAADYRGCGLNLEASMVWSLKRVAAKWIEFNPFFKFTVILMMRSKALQGIPFAGQFAAKHEAEVGEIVSMVDDLIPKLHTLPSTAASYEMAKEILKRLEDDGEGEKDEKDENDKDTKGEKSEEKSDAKPKGKDDLSEKAKRLLKDGIASDKAKRNKDTTSLHDFTVKEIGKSAGSTSGWRPFTTEYDRCVPPDGKPNQEAYAKMFEAVRPHVNVVASVLVRTLLADTKARTLHGLTEGKIDVNALSRLRTGQSSVFKKRKKGKDLDTYVEIFVDHSGSMSGSKIHTATQTCIALAEALERCRIPFGISGFTCSFDDYGVPAHRIKTLREDYDRICDYDRIGDYYGSRSKGWDRVEPLIEYVYKTGDQALAAVKPLLALMCHQRMSNNADGDSLFRVAKRVMRTRKEKRKIIMVLSDGIPSAGGSGSHTQRLKDVVKVLERTPGLELLGIGIQTDAPAKFYSKSVVVHKIDELPSVAMTQLKALLKH